MGATIELIETEKRALIRTVHEYVESQKKLWRQVPWLALQADGRDGWSNHYANAYCNGLWIVGESSNGYYNSFIDCATGKLVGYKFKPLPDCFVLDLVTELDDLNAQTIVESLKEEAKKERPSYYSVEEWKDAENRRKRKAIEYGVDKVYKRTCKPNWD
jgi:hypothetical protein